MGSWDSGIFDNDTASECIGVVIKKLVQDVQHDIASLDDNVLERSTPACIAMLNALAGIAPVDVSVVLSSTTVNDWRELLKRWFDKVQISEARDSMHWEYLGALVDKECEELTTKIKSVDS
jgi:hypothetical protein